jgi:hypothetical protein
VCRPGANPAPAARFPQQTVEFDALDFIAPSALLAQQRRPVMRVTETLAGRMDVAAFDLVESMVEEKPELAIDVGPWRDGPALTACEAERLTTRAMPNPGTPHRVAGTSNAARDRKRLSDC